MQFYLVICGYGVHLTVNYLDFMDQSRTILGWSILQRGIIWRGERHTRYEGSYTYRCIKNGEDVEKISFRSPVVNHIL